MGISAVYSWKVNAPRRAWFLVLLTLVIPPLGLWFLYHLWGETEQSISIRSDAIGLSVQRWPFGYERVQLSRKEIGAVRVHVDSQPYLTIDHGLNRYLVRTGPIVTGLSAPELEWLAEQINAWKLK